MIEIDIQPSPLRNTGGRNVPVPYYSEMEWTPVLSAHTVGNLSVTYDHQWGRATRIGRIVHLEGVIDTTAFTHTNASDELRLTGIPDVMAPLSDNSFRQRTGALSFEGITKIGYTQFLLNIIPGETFLTVVAMGTAVDMQTVQITELPSGGTPAFIFSISYSI